MITQDAPHGEKAIAEATKVTINLTIKAPVVLLRVITSYRSVSCRIHLIMDLTGQLRSLTFITSLDLFCSSIVL